MAKYLIPDAHPFCPGTILGIPGRYVCVSLVKVSSIATTILRNCPMMVPLRSLTSVPGMDQREEVTEGTFS